MIPPVSLPLNGPIQSARAGAHASIPHMATRLAAPIIRIADSISLRHTLGRIGRHEKNGDRPGVDFSAGVAALHLTLPSLSRHRQALDHPADSPMRDFFTSLKRLNLGATLAVLFALLAFGQPAEAANPGELNFWLSGPRYDGRVAEC